MDILQALPRHSTQLELLRRHCEQKHMIDCKYVIVAIDGPESINRQASWASDFNDVDTHQLFQALADQTRP